MKNLPPHSMYTPHTLVLLLSVLITGCLWDCKDIPKIARSKKYAWGKRVNEVRVGTAALFALQGKTSGPPVIQYVIWNGSRESIRFSEPSYVILRNLVWLDGKIDVTGPDGMPLRAVRAGPSPRRRGDIRPGQVYEGHLDLAEYFDFKQPGRYRVALTLRPSPGSDPWGDSRFWVSAGKFSMTLPESDVQAEVKPKK
jgi:hypothetical protein